MKLYQIFFGLLLLVAKVAIAGTPPPPIPLNVKEYADGDGTYNVTWGGVSEATYFKFYEKTNGVWTQYGGKLASSQLSYPISGRVSGLYSYVIHSCNEYGCAGLLTAKVTVDLDSQTPTVTASWSTSVVDYNTLATLSWSSDYADSCTLDGKTVSISGSKSYTLTATTTKKVTCINEWAGGEIRNAAEATIGVKPPPIPLNVKEYADGDGTYNVTWGGVSEATYFKFYEKANGVWTQYGGKLASSQLSYPISGRVSGLYSYVIYSCNEYGCAGLLTAKVTVDLDSQTPIVTASWDTSVVDYNTLATLSWSSDYADSCTLDGDTVSIPGSKSYTLTATTTKTVTCINEWAGGFERGEASASIEVRAPIIKMKATYAGAYYGSGLSGQNSGFKDAFYEGDENAPSNHADNCSVMVPSQSPTNSSFQHGGEFYLNKSGLNLDCLVYLVAESNSNTYFYRFSTNTQTHWDKFGTFMDKLNAIAPDTKVYAYLPAIAELKIVNEYGQSVTTSDHEVIAKALNVNYGVNPNFAGMAIDDWTYRSQSEGDFTAEKLLKVRNSLKAGGNSDHELLITGYLHNDFFDPESGNQNKGKKITDEYRISCGTNTKDLNGQCYSFDGLIFVLFEYILRDDGSIFANYKGVMPEVEDYSKVINGVRYTMIGINSQLSNVNDALSIPTKIYPLFYATGYDNNKNTDTSYLQTIPARVYALTNGIFMYHLQTYSNHLNHGTNGITPSWEEKSVVISDVFGNLQ